MRIQKATLALFSAVMIASVVSFSAEASWTEQARTLVEKYLGDDLAVKLFGEKAQEYQLPEIPEISKDTKSLKVYNRSKDPNAHLANRKDMDKFNYKFIVEVYQVTKEKKPTDAELSNWLNTLSQGGTREGIYRALVLDQSYSAKEGMQFPLNDSAIDFTIKFFARYLDRGVSKEQLEKSNFYTLKRVATERALDVVEAYILKNRKDLFEWFAIFSAEIARDYPQAFKKSWRTKTSVEFHRAWAKKVPEQLLISEVFIKMHMLFNQFR